MERTPMTTIRTAIGSDIRVLVRRSIFNIPPDLTLSGWDQRILQRIQTQPSSLADLLNDTSSEERTLRLVYLLRELGLVELHIT